MAEQVIEITRTTDASPDAVFELLLDATGWPSWSPLGSGTVERAASDGAGAVGEIRVFRTGRVSSRERVIASERPSHFAYELLSGLPLRGYQAHVRIAPTRDGASITWRSTFRAKVPGTGWIYRRALGRFIRQLVDGLAVAAVAAGVTAPADATAPAVDTIAADTGRDR
jgi:hypothetical protein